ncbi:MAG: symmetrical bis(5'-nucleosyl)-tetraphosphatase [Proteobacteria bacterium]|nr:symmetrical bis(5'-nucleosyl)-tetraphosphatase [Pseudomonadota bacterium]
MSTYAIGDIQGCFNEFQKLLKKIHFDPAHDQLWFAGDLVNRGPQSLEVLRFIQSLPKSTIVILGNHDLHLLAVAYGVIPIREKDTIHPILNAPDCESLCHWLRQQKLMHYDHRLNSILVHAGIAPQWNLEQAQNYAKEIETILQSEQQYLELLKHMYGNTPTQWQESLTGWERYRLITNYFTRMRICKADGELDLHYNKGLTEIPENYMPWFQCPNRALKNTDILFGHWAALNGETHTPHVIALDTGCVWGNQLTAMRVEDGEKYQVNAETST